MPNPLFIHRCGPGPCRQCRLDQSEKRASLLRSRLRQIAEIIEAVDHRAIAADGDVTNTREEMTDAEMRRIYRLAKSGG